MLGTVRARIAAVATLVVVVVLVATAIGLVVTQRRVLIADLEDSLRRRADELTSDVVAGASGSTLADGGDDDVTQVVAADGTVLASDPDLAAAAPIADSPGPPGASSFVTIEGLPVDDEPFRVLSRSVETGDARVVVHVGTTLDDVDESSAVLVTSLAVVIPAVAVLLAVLVWWLVGRTLRPVEAIRSEVAALGGGELAGRVSQPPGDDEIARLARTMNAMLDRIEAASERQRRFAADASHELRGPLARMRAELEVDVAHPESADTASTYRSVLEETSGLERLVDDLLHLARRDADADADAGPARDPVDLDDLVLAEARRLRDGGRLVVDTSAVSAAQVEGDATQLARALRNLVDNASRHAASRVTFTVAERDDEAVLAVADDGPGIPPAQRERVFERFARLDDARTPGAGGTGLGLAIARDVVERHGGSLVVDPEHRPGARLVARIPARRDGRGAHRGAPDRRS